MKLRVSAFLIILSTAAVIGVITILVNKTTPLESTYVPESKEAHEGKLPPAKTHSAQHPRHEQAAKQGFLEPNEQGVKKEEILVTDGELSKEDVQKINSVAKLKEAELKKELMALKERIEKEDLFGQLEERLLPKEKESEVKETLERFALLGLEETRRKYMHIEPELKDPIYALKDSLHEIRELLEEDFDEE